MNGIQKTALFLSGLERQSVNLLLDRLPPDEAKAVRHEMLALGDISVQATERVASEFLETMDNGQEKSRTANYELPQTDYQPSTYKNRFRQSQFNQTAERVPPPTNLSRRHFSFLRSLPAETIAEEIVEELPQTIAVVLAHIQASKAGEVLAILPEPLQLDVAKRLTQYEPANEQLLQDIEVALKERFLLRLETEERKVKERTVMNTLLYSFHNAQQQTV
ncbi:MAG: hypothetical protein LBN39_09935 [Planctomycetaceae bacterium]|jgi:flagellar motor switch protein FliG|nr:hypothetical protein [Planctomycetaceae bacterium]